MNSALIFRFNLLTYALQNKVVNISLKYRIINNELECMWRERVTAFFFFFKYSSLFRREFKKSQTLVTITSVKPEILKEIPENKTGGPGRVLLSPHFLLCFSTDYTLSRWFPHQISEWRLYLRRRSNPKVICPF
jgi:hypothetical protein